MPVFLSILSRCVIVALASLGSMVATADDRAASTMPQAAISLGRFAITCPGVRPSADQRALAYSFRATILADIEAADTVRARLPIYRDSVVLVAHGYCGFVARNARRADPSELAKLISARLLDDPDSPHVTFILPDFVEKALDAR